MSVLCVKRSIVNCKKLVLANGLLSSMPDKSKSDAIAHAQTKKPQQSSSDGLFDGNCFASINASIDDAREERSVLYDFRVMEFPQPLTLLPVLIGENLDWKPTKLSESSEIETRIKDAASTSALGFQLWLRWLLFWSFMLTNVDFLLKILVLLDVLRE